ncbi:MULTISPECIES: tetratricopeptide repeat protein [unclassified Thermoactinomyces]|uniref:helix-turn-helix domain-containing protein n=1 Tax=unclassified Thermoactinomyces TaxID=2634588 RepID=UPI0018DDCB31|nr:tetratricopeptide repeat protein [Thermoactinomyces sp. CICC 10522]MBH8608538.1 tetratricopeptide repeat protein [Thermoactinomyces sp. CICC 10521]
MNAQDLKALGEALRRIRKEKGFRLKDLEDHRISFATISSIERGVPTVKPQNRIYYCQKLGFDIEDLPSLINKERENRSQIENLLFLIETCINLDCDGALERLRMLQQESKGQFMDIILYLKGLCYMKKNNLKAAEKYINQAIELIDSGKGTMNENNIKAACFNELGRIYYLRDNNLNKALDFVNKGLNVFIKSGDRQELQYELLIGKVSYLEKLYRTDEALQTLDELWASIQNINRLDVKLNMYELKATLLNQKKKFQTALTFAKEGLYIARANGTHEQAVRLLTVWGNILQNAGDLQTAENCYQLALRLENKLKDKKYVLVSTLTQLGKLYGKRGEWEQSFNCLNMAVNRGRKYNDAHRFCESLMALGDYYLETDEYAKAITPYEEALEISTQYNFSRQKEKSLLNLSECWKKMGNTEKYVALLDELQSELRLREQEGLET